MTKTGFLALFSLGALAGWLSVRLVLFGLGVLVGWCAAGWLMRQALYGDVWQR